MKLHSPEIKHHMRAGEAVRGMAESGRHGSEVERLICAKDKKRIIDDLENSKPKKWDDPHISNWLVDFERCVVVFPDSKPQLNNTPEAWNAILEVLKELLPGWLVKGQLVHYLTILKFVYSNFPERRGEFPVDPSLVRDLTARISEIRSGNPIHTASILQILGAVRYVLPEVYKKLAEENKGLFSHDLPTGGAFKDANVLGVYLARIKLIYPEIFKKLPVDASLIEKMKMKIKPLKQGEESNFLLYLAYALRILTADEVTVDKNGKLTVVDHGLPVANSQELPPRTMV